MILTYIYIYIYICVCVCVCVCYGADSTSFPQIILVKRESYGSQKEQLKEKKRGDNSITKMTIYLSGLQIKM